MKNNFDSNFGSDQFLTYKKYRSDLRTFISSFKATDTEKKH